MMVWVVMIAGMQVLGIGATLGRLAYDEWNQWRLSQTRPAAMAGHQHNSEFEPWRATATM
jgi:hypothetical protein